MNDVFLGLVNALSANPAMLLLCVVLIGMWQFVTENKTSLLIT
jgi:hypothetical protein